jgi:Cu(I)/Ag(I) efflux system membrane protein CusA/SilA
VYWYTLEGRDERGRPAGGWDPHELRSIQDFQVRYSLASVPGVAEVASVGGFVREYQVDVDPTALRVADVKLNDVLTAVRRSNVDVGARTVEISNAEYVVRGIGTIEDLEDLESVVVGMRRDVPVRLRDVATVGLGPALRRGVLDKGGAEAVGGVVVVRYGENPLQVIQAVKERIDEIAGGLPSRTLEDGTVSRVTVVPFYDRTGLIRETLQTLQAAISNEVMVTVLVVLVLVANLATSVLVTTVLPLAVLLAFLAMRVFGVDANIVALSGIAIAIGTIVDMGVVVSENVLRHLRESAPDEPRREVIRRATTEVAPAVLTAILTTVVSFLPVFTMEGAEGKLFRPLAATKTFTLLASVLVALLVLPAMARLIHARRRPEGAAPRPTWRTRLPRIVNVVVIVAAGLLLTRDWMPLGIDRGYVRNLAFVLLLFGAWLGAFWLLIRRYESMLRVALRWPAAVAGIALLVVVGGGLVWRGLGREFMPPLEEGSYLFMPTTMPHASIGEATDVLRKLDLAIESVPEVELAVGKIGRVESPLDPAPVSMVETVVQVKNEFRTDERGRVLRFRWDRKADAFARDESGELIPDAGGRPFRQWRDGIESPDDIWDEIVEVAQLPGTTSAPRLQPIAARLVMLQSGMRAPLGVKVRGPDLATIESVGLEIERLLKEVEGVKPATVIADRVVGKPYLEIRIDREAIGRYGLHVADVQDVIEVAVGGRAVTTTVEGRERYAVRVRYLRELRDSLEEIGRIAVPTPGGAQIPLEQVADIEYVRGPQAIKSEDLFLVSYVVFDREPGFAEVDVVEAARAYLDERVASGELEVPAGVSWSFAGTYENQVRASRRLRLVLPLALLAILVLLHLQFRDLRSTLLVFSGVAIAWAGGFLLLGLYQQPWFLDFSLFGASMRDVFGVHPIHLSVAVWVGFLALFGIATDDGVLMATHLGHVFGDRRPTTRDEIREATVEAALKRVRPCVMTTVTTILALLPVLSSTGKGSDILVPMAIPTFGGMTVATISLFLIPTAWAWMHGIRAGKGAAD